MNYRSAWASKTFAVTFIVCFAPSLTGLQPASAASCSGAAIADKASGAMIAAAQAGSAKGFADALQTHADMKVISIFALGKHRKSLPDARLKEFVSLTTSFVSRKFQDYRLKFRAESQTVLDCRGDKVIGRLDFLGGKPQQQIIWRLKGSRVTDVNVQSVWLSQLLRTQFDKVLNTSNGDIEALFAVLRK